MMISRTSVTDQRFSAIEPRCFFFLLAGSYVSSET